MGSRWGQRPGVSRRSQSSGQRGGATGASRVVVPTWHSNGRVPEQLCTCAECALHVEKQPLLPVHCILTGANTPRGVFVV